MHFSNIILAMSLASNSGFVTAAPINEDLGTLNSRGITSSEKRSVLATRDETITVSSDTGTKDVVVAAASGSAGLDSEGVSTGKGGKMKDIAGDVFAVLVTVGQFVYSLAGDDSQKRQEFTQQTAARIRSMYPGHKVVVCNVGYTFTGTPLTKQSTSFNAKIGKDVTFDVLVFDSGTFTREGDGGFQNWAYVVDTSCTINEKGFTCP